MNKLFSLVALLFALCATSFAQQHDTITVRIKGMRCDECAHKVMVKVMENKGVDDIWFNIERPTATTSYEKTMTAADAIRQPLQGTRYNTTDYSPSDTIMRGFGQRMAE